MDELDGVRERTREAWGSGDFTRFAEMLEPSATDLLERLGIVHGDEVLDVGCGTGNLAIRAARRGARVTGVDLTPPMLEAARRAGEAAGVEVAWVEGDAEDLPVPDAAFDVVVSSFGCMFAPRHAVAARELARAMRPGGRLGVLTWPLDSDVADFLRVASAHLPPPSPVAEPPLLWGDEAHVRGLFAATDVELAFETGTLDFAFGSAEAAADAYLTDFGPLVAARAALEPQGRWEPLAADIRGFFAERGSMMTSTYMKVLGRAGG